LRAGCPGNYYDLPARTGSAAPDPGGRSNDLEGPAMSVKTASPTDLAPLAAPFVATPDLDGDVLTITMSGELDIATAHLLQEAQLSGHGPYRALRYNLAGLGFMDSAGLNALLAPAGSGVPIGQISVTGPMPIVRRLLEITGLQGMIDG
jgi:anti-anti-sigma factor